MRQSFPSNQISTNLSTLDSIGSQFGISEGSLSSPPICKTPNNEMTFDEIQIVEMNRQSRKYGQNAQANLMKVYLGNRTHNFAIEEAEPNELSNICTDNTVKDSAIYSGSINSQVRLNKTEVQKKD
ncbi:hypothetical protein AVEN_19591-1 [Araneus ventricosus]|uniref:Uncharacterized protein n=1 Tax=Araneus ventricosus TaxID=182803 RepID=A0A4Y2VAI7_ARAVE|nr:hypothetical protein AVEN_19591-1 [Araneus ventricosus]